MLPKTKQKPVDKLSDYSLLFHGESGIGKSTLGSEFPEALMLAIEPGLNAIECYQVAIKSHEDLREIYKEIAAGDHKFKTIVVDTLDALYELCAIEVLREHKVEHETDLMYGKGWSLVRTKLMRFMYELNKLPYQAIYLAHSTEKTIVSPTETLDKVQPLLPKGALQQVLGAIDCIGYLDLEITRDPQGQPLASRVVRFDVSKRYSAKDRSKNFPPKIALPKGKMYESILAAWKGGN